MTDVDETPAMPSTAAMQDWTTDYDIFDAEYITDPYPIWSDLRGECPVAHTERWGGSWLPTKYDDVVGMAHEGPTVALCHELIDGFIDSGRFDGAVHYAQQIPPRVIANLMGIDPNAADQFVDWVRGTLELGLVNPAVREKYRGKISEFFMQEIADRRAAPRDDLISQLLEVEIDGELISDRHVQGTCNLMLVAGIDTTWSSIGSAVWHLASHPEDRERLVAEPALIPSAVSNLARMEMQVAIAVLLERIPDFQLEDPSAVTWAGGQVRGPRILPITF